MAKVFISYRRIDSAASSGRIYDRLVARFKRKNVFKDVDDIPAGVDFGGYIQQSLRECAVMLVVIGPRWLDARADDGSRRLDDPADWVRVEIETALALGLTVIPLLVEGASMPKAADLPDSLRELAHLNALPVRNDPDFSHDMERVIAAVERAISASRPMPGIFRRKVGSTPIPTQATPEQPEPLLQPDPTPTHAAFPATDTVVESPAAPVPPKQPPAPDLPGKRRARRVALAGVAIAPVMTSIAMLFSYGIISFDVGSGINQRSTQTSTILPRPTATQTPILTRSLVFALPGPGSCIRVSKTQEEENSWVAIPEDDIDCSSGRATRISASCYFCGISLSKLEFISANSGIYLPSAYTIRVQISGLAANTEAHFYLMDTGGTNEYDFGIYNNLHIRGQAYYQVSGSGCAGRACTDYFDVNKLNTLTFQARGDTIWALLNGGPVAAQPLIPGIKIENIGFSVSAIPQDQNYTGYPYHADFSNFSITPY